MVDFWYRYKDVRYSSGVDVFGESLPGPGRLEIVLEEFQVIKYTPKGVWLRLWDNKNRFVLKGSCKRFACPTLEEAKVSFIARKKRQYTINKHSMEQAQEAISMIMGEQDAIH